MLYSYLYTPEWRLAFSFYLQFAKNFWILFLVQHTGGPSQVFLVCKYIECSCYAVVFRLLMKTDPDRWHSAALFQCSETCRFVVRKHWKYYFLFKSLSIHVLVLLFAMELPTAGLHFLHPKNFIEIQCIYVRSLAFALQSWQVFSICLFLRTEQIPSREIATKVKEWRDLLEETWKLPVKTNVCLGNMFKAMNKQLTL